MSRRSALLVTGLVLAIAAGYYVFVALGPNGESPLAGSTPSHRAPAATGGQSSADTSSAAVDSSATGDGSAAVDGRDAVGGSVAVEGSGTGDNSATAESALDDPTLEARQSEPPVEHGFTVVNAYPHDPSAFTQGLVYVDGTLYEGTGLYGESSLRRVELETGEVLQSKDIPRQYFGEGIAVLEDSIIQLTWRENTALVHDRETFEQLGQFDYQTEGWGLTLDEGRLIMSDGSPNLYFRDPTTFELLGQVEVTDRDVPVSNLNELEMVNGELFANIWLTDRIAVIEPDTGIVVAWIDLTGLLPPEQRPPGTDVLNGIAYDAAADRLFVTGKKWPTLFQIELVPERQVSFGALLPLLLRQTETLF